MSDTRTVALAQIAPVWLDRDATLRKVEAWTARAADRGAHLVCFGEALVPGYPFWVEHTDGARFEDRRQKELYAHYLDQGVDPDVHLEPLAALARERGVTVVLGCMERAFDRGGHSLYCAMVVIDDGGVIHPCHRKLVPTHEERLVWAPGDGHGLVCHALPPFTLGGLNCWENWLPLPRAALHAQGEDLHVALWPGNRRNTEDVTRFLAREGRSYVLSVAGLMRRADVPDHVPHAAALRAALPETPADGGSCVAAPDGTWLVEPVVGQEELVTAELEHAFVRRERHNFDHSGHYGRPEILHVELDRTRHRALRERE